MKNIYQLQQPLKNSTTTTTTFHKRISKIGVVRMVEYGHIVSWFLIPTYPYGSTRLSKVWGITLTFTLEWLQAN
jgi:hypothetical protein